MGQKQRRDDHAAQAGQVAVGPCGQHVAILPRPFVPAVPRDAEPVAIGAQLCLGRRMALLQQRMDRVNDHILQRDGRAEIGGEAAHGQASPA